LKSQLLGTSYFANVKKINKRYAKLLERRGDGGSMSINELDKSIMMMESVMSWKIDKFKCPASEFFMRQMELGKEIKRRNAQNTK